ncbi:MAG TPA: CPBP family intramembrane glutamic endopeptidase [Terriglobales bacterium]|nr:CPBP family intramembrane glutamic endopeptidase [Terriglobales bacterium]
MRKTWKEVGLGFLNLLAVVVVILLAQPVLRRVMPSAGGLVLGLTCLAAYVAGSRWIERRSPSELAPGRAVPETAAGLAGGIALFSSVMIILRMAGVYHPAGWGNAHQLATGFALALLAGITEEILFRGLLFRLSSKILGTWGALLLTAALFGAAHAANRGATISSSLAIALEAGILLGASYAATQRLWVPIGLHVGWNFAEGSLFGMTLSGNVEKAGLIAGSLAGPRILTGGEFGPEASIVAVLVCLVAAAFFIWRILKLHRAEPPVWRARPS